MVNAIGLSDPGYLIMGTLSMLLMTFNIIAFALMFQRKLARKAREYREIEILMQKQELRSAYFVIQGQEQERKRIAAELHDNLGSLLATLKIYSDLAVEKTEIPEIRRLNDKISRISSTLGDEVRKLSHELDLKTLSGFGLAVAVKHLCEAITDSGKIKISSFIDVSKPIDEEVSLHIYRIIQELFTNTLKHASASHVRIEITQIGETVSVIYEDNGQGFDTEALKAGMGIQNIKSRVRQIQGELTIDSSSKGSAYILELNDHD